MSDLRLARFGAGDKDADLCRVLMREYAAFLNVSVGGEHICVESLERELAGLPGAYATPGGGVLLAFVSGEAAGCVALKPLQLEDATNTDERACEMKRLWVRPAFQGQQVGRALAEGVVKLARARGYTAMYLDTMPESMRAAFALYRAMGFEPVERYLDNPVLRRTESLAIAFLRKEL